MDEQSFYKLIDDLKGAKQYVGFELEEKVRICTGVAVSLVLCPDPVLRALLQDKFKKWIDTTDLDRDTKKLFKRFLVSEVYELIDLIMTIDIDENMKIVLLEDIKKLFS